ncbi:hypothetical protein MSAN_01773500 [Mycena sanguinolenta]|uniref:Uncharacterized protein n=1 Tax=Mycena sanguinolenta TaxID=230812 RepID=A0A8H7CS23_9AGAR|nr:hypothetical protein MSAN_01773500 [Mycena sanguinolenta]
MWCPPHVYSGWTCINPLSAARSHAPFACSVFLLMTISFAPYPPPKWLMLRRTALKRASRLIRHMHLAMGPSLALLSYPLVRPLKPEPPLRAVLRDPDACGLDNFVVFDVEQTLFKVHLSLFLLKTWSPADFVDSTSITINPVILSETAENFRFFLWDLHAFPYELVHLHAGDSNVIQVVGRLLNITEMAQKHNLSVLEIHALRSLHDFVLSSHFHSISSGQHCRALKIALTTSVFSENLLDDLSRRLIYHILRRKSELAHESDFLSLVERDSRLRKVRGAVYYRQLIDVERRPDNQEPEFEFPPVLAKDMEERCLRAHISLSALSARVCASAPLIPSCDRSSHSAAWEEIWASAVAVSETRFMGSVDILGRLRHMMPLLKRMVPAATMMSVGCGLAALEAVVALRHDILDSLLDHFVD